MPKKKTVDILVDHRRCKGCEICAAFCPRKVYEMRDQKAVPVNIPECIACELCVIRCPDFAIELVFETPDAAPGGAND